MPVTGGRGFSLVEALVAIAVLACTVAAATSLVQSGSAAQARSERRQLARLAAENEIERLRSLPFVAATTTGETGEAAARSVVSEVFPHAIVARNTPEASYRGDDGSGAESGTFTSVRVGDAGRVTTTARFVVCGREGWAGVSSAALDGYCYADAGWLPAASLEVEVVVIPAASRPAPSFSCSAVISAGP